MKTTNPTLTSLFLALALSLALSPQALAGGLLTSPSEDETPPVVEQEPAAEPEKKPEQAPKAKDDSKEKKTAKKKKEKVEKSESAPVSSEVKTDDKAEVKTSDKDKDKDSKPKKAEKKNKKSDDKAAQDKDSDAKKVDKAAEKNDDEKKPAEKDANAPSTVLDGEKKAKSDVPLPKRLASFTCGAFLGYPVAMAKRTVHQTKAGNKDFIGDSTNPIKVGIATMVSLPFGFVGGVFEGAQYSVYNSWKGSGEEPFGKATFSLDDD